MLQFYHVYTTIYHNEEELDIRYIGETIQEESNTHDKIEQLTWENLNDYYYNHSLNCNFNIYHFKKGRVISFFNTSLICLIKNKNWRDIFEWKNVQLNITIKIEYKKFTPSLKQIQEFHNGELAIQYLNERMTI